MPLPPPPEFSSKTIHVYVHIYFHTHSDFSSIEPKDFDPTFLYLFKSFTIIIMSTIK